MNTETLVWLGSRNHRTLVWLVQNWMKNTRRLKGRHQDPVTAAREVVSNQRWATGSWIGSIALIISAAMFFFEKEFAGFAIIGIFSLCFLVGGLSSWNVSRKIWKRDVQAFCESITALEDVCGPLSPECDNDPHNLWYYSSTDGNTRLKEEAKILLRRKAHSVRQLDGIQWQKPEQDRRRRSLTTGCTHLGYILDTQFLHGEFLKHS